MKSDIKRTLIMKEKTKQIFFLSLRTNKNPDPVAKRAAMVYC